MSTTAVRWQDVPIPARLWQRPLDRHGRPVPWFVAWIGGVPDFRIIGPSKLQEALTGRLCWMCGEPMGMFSTFVVGPMCAVNRISSEPPSHAPCAAYAARACPFLTHPAARRRETSLPEDTIEPGGVMIRRNPGVALLWVTRRYDVWFPKPAEGPIIRMGDPDAVHWYAKGRAADRTEVLNAMSLGLPELRRVAMLEGPEATAELDAQIRAALQHVPDLTQPRPEDLP